MDAQAKLTALIELAESLGIQVRPAPPGESSDHPGGAYARLKGREMIFLAGSAGPADQIDVLAAALRTRPQLQEQLEERSLPPEIRQLLEG